MRKSINELIKNPRKNSDRCFNFYDWFCEDYELEDRMEEMLPKIEDLVEEGIIDGDKNYVWFKNNCPMNGELYDDFRISTLDNSNFLGGFCPKEGHYATPDNEKCVVWHFNTADGNMVQYKFADWLDFMDKIKMDKEFKDELTKAFHFKDEKEISNE